MYRTCAVVALLLVNNVSSLDIHPTKGVSLKPGTTLTPMKLKLKPSSFKMTTMRSAHSHSRIPSSNTLTWDSINSMSPNSRKTRRLTRRHPPITTMTNTKTTTTTSAPEKKIALSKMDVCLFATYFFNIIAVTLSVVTIPALAAEYFSTPHATAAFVAGVASMAPIGGGFGKIINGFVCQRLGGRRSSWLYLVALAVLSVGMSVTTSAAPIGLILMGYEFLSSIQWTSLCYIMTQQYEQQPELMGRGIAIISLASTTGALAAKTFGAALLSATNWRIVTQCGAGSALLGALAMKIGVTDPQVPKDALESTNKKIGGETPNAKKEEKGGGLVALKAILSNPLFWQIGVAHSLGYLGRGNDRLLGSFLEEISNLPRK
jgi:sugar phosphate permease